MWDEHFLIVTLYVQTFSNAPLLPVTTQTNQAVYIIVRSPRDICDSSYWVRLKFVWWTAITLSLSHKIMHLWNCPFLGGFAKLQKATLSFVASLCSSICMKKTRLPLDWLSKNFMFENFFKICRENHVSLKSDKKNGYPAWTLMYNYDKI